MATGGAAKLAGSRQLAWAIAIASLGVTLLATLWSTKVAENRAETNLRQRAETARELIDRRMDAYTEVLYGVSGLRSSSQTLTRAEFHRYIQALDVLRRYRGVQVIGFGELVRGDRTAFEARVRADAAASGLEYGPFAIDPPGVRPEYAPISFIEPQQGNEDALGYDFLANPNRREALQRSRDSGAPAATAPTTLVQDTQRQPGFLLMQATYRSKVPPNTLQGRRETFVGVEYAAFRMSDLMNDVLRRENATENVTENAELEIYDRGLASGTRLLPLSKKNRTYDTNSRADALRSKPPDNLAAPLPVTVGGRHWDVYYQAKDPLASAQERAAPAVIGILGTGLSILAAWLFWMIATSRERALNLAQQMTAALRESQQQLARSNTELERFAYVASHDLQEPLRTVTSFVSLLKKRYDGQLDERAQKYIGFTVDATTRMSQMISDLLKYSRVGRVDSEPESTDLAAAWDEAVQNLHGTIANERAQVSRGDLPTVLGTRLHAVQLFQNLIGNALKYRGPEPPVITAEAALLKDGKEWGISVSDNGIGIDPRHHERIFVVFQRLHTVEEYPGTGMGLAICKKIVETYGGRIWVESQPGQGARFRFTMRATATPAGTTSAPQASATTASATTPAAAPASATATTAPATTAAPATTVSPATASVPPAPATTASARTTPARTPPSGPGADSAAAPPGTVPPTSGTPAFKDPATSHRPATAGRPEGGDDAGPTLVGAE